MIPTSQRPAPGTYRARMLSYVDREGRRRLASEQEVGEAPGARIVLGEPGSGKSTTLASIAMRLGTTVRSANSFLIQSDPRALVDDNKPLVIDALDEVAAARESDPVFRVLEQLLKAGSPPFILSCRAAEWRGASARQDISNEYGSDVIEFRLEPLDRVVATETLASDLGRDAAELVIESLDRNNLPELYGNPLTLRLLGEVAKHDGRLPTSRAELLARASELLWKEHNDRKRTSELAGLSSDAALDAGGLISAALILTGAEGLSRLPSGNNDATQLPLVELTGLANSDDDLAVVGSRLFVESETGSVKLIHRTIAEFLGARWLARQARRNQTYDRVLGLLTYQNGVPSSLRGLHAWLPSFDADFFDEVVARDPYGFLRYGNAQHLTFEQARALVASLQRLQDENPYFRAEDWGTQAAVGLGQSGLGGILRTTILSEATGFHLRSLLLESIRGTPAAEELRETLLDIVLNRGGLQLSYAERMDAFEAVRMASGNVGETALVEALRELGRPDDTRLALGIMDACGYGLFSDALIASTVVRHLGLDVPAPRDDDEVEHTSGSFYSLGKNLPTERLEPALLAVVDRLPDPLPSLSFDTEWELNSLFFSWLGRLLDDPNGAPSAGSLLRILRAMADHRAGAEQDRVDVYLREHDELRRELQRGALVTGGDISIWDATRLSEGLTPTADDIVAHLELLARSGSSDRPADVGLWRELTNFSRRFPREAETILRAAAPFAAGSPQLDSFLDDLRAPRVVADWENDFAERRRVREAEEEQRIAQTRADFEANRSAVEAGELRWSYPVAQAYLGRFRDLPQDSPEERVRVWLGPDIAQAALDGLGRVPDRTDLPTLTQVIDTYLESRHWNFIYPMIASIVAEVRRGGSLQEFDIDFLLAVRIGMQQELLEEKPEQKIAAQAIEDELRRQPGQYERYIRLLIEPYLKNNSSHIRGLYGFARSDRDDPLRGKLAIEWLTTYRDMPEQVAVELIDAVADSGGAAQLSEIARRRLTEAGAAGQRQIWQSVGLATEFDEFARAIGNPEPELLWALRDRLRGDRFETRRIDVRAKLLGWIVSKFRNHWPRRQHPSGVWSGSTNQWDATEFIDWAIRGLASLAEDEAEQELSSLRAEPQDDYTDEIKHAAAQQRQLLLESRFPQTDLQTLRAVAMDGRPRTSHDLQAVLVRSIRLLQQQLRGSDTNIRDKYFRDDGRPRTEDECTARLTEDLERLLAGKGIARAPQAQMPDGKIADLLFSVGDASVPIEAKGQWNTKLWSAAGDQLQRLYLRDWRTAEYGIYLVYWFGKNVPGYKPTANNGERPDSAAQLQRALQNALPPSGRGAIAVEVLDFTQ